MERYKSQTYQLLGGSAAFSEPGSLNPADDWCEDLCCFVGWCWSDTYFITCLPRSDDVHMLRALLLFLLVISPFTVWKCLWAAFAVWPHLFVHAAVGLMLLGGDGTFSSFVSLFLSKNQVILWLCQHRLVSLGKIPLFAGFDVMQTVICGVVRPVPGGRPKGLPYIIHYALAHQAAQAVLLWSHSKRALVISLPLGGQLLEQRRQKLQPTPACSDCSGWWGVERWGPPFWHASKQILVAGWLFSWFWHRMSWPEVHGVSICSVIHSSTLWRSFLMHGFNKQRTSEHPTSKSVCFIHNKIIP